MFGSNPGNCLRALGTVGAVASLNMVVAIYTVSSIELILQRVAAAAPTKPSARVLAGFETNIHRPVIRLNLSFVDNRKIKFYLPSFTCSRV
ncbi:MAG: hypothetical protein KJO34_05825 [Deltaproteobacteria bacterium]|nr:hypothetical protein [Deltaproteobacteria bacterium]